jgi:DNA-binding IclR family transcriptional regulator
MQQNTSRVKTTQTSFRIIESIKDQPGIGVSELSRKIDLSKSAVHKHVRTLVDMNYLVCEDDLYYLSTRFLSLGMRARERFPVDAAERIIHDLADTTGHTSNLVVHENGRGVYALRAKPVGVGSDGVTEGDAIPLHATAGGKAILAFFPANKRAKTLGESELQPYTTKTITDRAQVERELQSVRDRRVAFDREEYIQGRQCVASPITDGDGNPVAAVSVTGVIERMSGKRLEVDITGLVASAAKSIQKELLSME